MKAVAYPLHTNQTRPGHWSRAPLSTGQGPLYALGLRCNPSFSVVGVRRRVGLRALPYTIRRAATEACLVSRSSNGEESQGFPVYVKLETTTTGTAFDLPSCPLLDCDQRELEAFDSEETPPTADPDEMSRLTTKK